MNSPYLNHRRRIMGPEKVLSPKTAKATAGAAATTTTVAPVGPPAPVPHSPTAQLSPKTREATTSDATTSDATTVAEEPPVAIDYNLPIDFKLSYEDFAQAIAALDPQERRILWSERLRYWAALKQRRRERQAAKQQKTAKKRAAASRRRNAA